MEEISVKGENYTKAALLAKKFGYTPDYIGQLCRGGQVKATLVGRSWYVQEESLIKHRKARYRSNLSKSKEEFRKIAQENSQPINLYSSRINRAHYENDESELFPQVSEKSLEIKKKDESSRLDENQTQMSTADDSNRISIRKSTEYEALKPSEKAPKPSVRTIPAFASHEISLKTAVLEPKTVRQRPRTALVVVGLVLMAFSIEILFYAAVIGLEKKIVTNPESNDLIVYNFNSEQVASVFNFLDKK